ncbi:copper resistance CopC family protein [Georgenia sp. H159]|uniref:copper resistance CopC family protein n=1 Tax=Georgenia sp. H159 TaxID=3076115 RepID=UPI002D785943|nr:copper resistance CopC family protein [Georgenia sp. H159]
MTILPAPVRLRSALVALLTLLGVVSAGAVAQAHDVLVGSDPAAGAVLDEAPGSIVLSFSDAPLTVGSAITVVDASGATVAQGEGTVDGTDVVLELGTPLPAGELEVRWRIASSDGHPIEGTIPFTVAGSPEPVVTEAAAETATTAAAPTAEPGPEVTAEPGEEASGLAALPLWLRVAIGVAALGAVAGFVVIVVRRLREDRL